MRVIERVAAFPGDVGYYMARLNEDVVEAFNPDLPLMAASVIKIPIMVCAFREIEAGRLNPDELVVVPPEAKKPSCGALNYLHDGLSVTVMDLIVLMIILSDNTATNLLIERLGIPEINACMDALGVPGISLRRTLFNPQAAAMGLENTVTARGIGEILTRLYRGTLLGGAADARMLEILGDQRLNGKLPFYLHSRGIRCAHKTGEDDGITHDVGIVYAARPFVVCMLSNRVDVPAFERLIQDAAAALAFGDES